MDNLDNLRIWENVFELCLRLRVSETLLCDGSKTALQYCLMQEHPWLCQGYIYTFIIPLLCAMISTWWVFWCFGNLRVSRGWSELLFVHGLFLVWCWNCSFNCFWNAGLFSLLSVLQGYVFILPLIMQPWFLSCCEILVLMPSVLPVWSFSTVSSNISHSDLF